MANSPFAFIVNPFLFVRLRVWFASMDSAGEEPSTIGQLNPVTQPNKSEDGQCLSRLVPESSFASVRGAITE